jgi:transcriptional repressor NrdR
VPTEYVDRALDHIVQKILGQGERELNSRDLGEIVMQELRLMDKVAYIRFASIYRSFQDVDDFHDVIRDLDIPHRRKADKSKPSKT